MKNITRFLAGIIPAIIFIFFSSPVRAVYMKSGDTVNLPKTQIINEAALVTGSSLVIDSDIDGDLYCAGRDITINGKIKGDVACMGQSIKINGTVDGDIRALAQTINITGAVSHNLTALSQ